MGLWKVSTEFYLHSLLVFTSPLEVILNVLMKKYQILITSRYIAGFEDVYVWYRLLSWPEELLVQLVPNTIIINPLHCRSMRSNW